MKFGWNKIQFTIEKLDVRLIRELSSGIITLLLGFCSFPNGILNRLVNSFKRKAAEYESCHQSCFSVVPFFDRWCKSVWTVVEKPIEREIRIIDLIRRINLDDDINYAINEWRKTLHTIGWSMRFSPTPGKSTLQSMFISARWSLRPIPECIKIIGEL